MAENETLSLDDRTASRWDPIRHRILSGNSFSDHFQDVEREFYLGLRRACRQMAQRGVPLETLLTTAYEQPDELESLVRQTRRQDYATLLLDVVQGQVFLSLEQLVEAWLSSVWDKIRDLLQLDLNGHVDDAAFNVRLREMLNRLARLIARNPARIPNRPRRSDDQTADDLDDTLNLSIL